jgi:L-amino acid N-acyltransferase YncA
MLRTVRTDDAAEISAIYNHYIQLTPTTFEEVPLAPEEMEQRIVETTQTYPWFVCEEEDKVVGYCYARRWRERAAYRHSAEATIYLHPSATGKALGSVLFDALLKELRKRKFHCVIGGVSLPNPASVALLEKFGLRQVAQFNEVGYKLGRWIDVGYWQLVL